MICQRFSTFKPLTHFPFRVKSNVMNIIAVEKKFFFIRQILIGIISVALVVCSVYYEPFMMQSAQSCTPDSSIFTLSFVEDVEAEPETVSTKADELASVSARTSAARFPQNKLFSTFLRALIALCGLFLFLFVPAYSDPDNEIGIHIHFQNIISYIQSQIGL